MKRREAKNQVTQLPDEHEYNFDSVLDDEIELCFLYEYGRCADAFKKLVADWRAANRGIIAAAEKLLKRKGPFGFTIGPTPETRKEATFITESKKRLTAANKRRADENGKAWSEWVQTSWQGGYPGQFPLDDPRVLLFYFPPFPKKAWWEIDADYRRRAPLLLSPALSFSGRLRGWLLLASKDFTEQMKAQKDIQAAVAAPMDEAALAAIVRRQVEQHILSPALIEENEGIERGLVGAVPPLFSWGKTRDQMCAEGFCREKVRFVVNWARPDAEILAALKHWLKAPGRRPHKDFKVGSVTSAREHLRKLGALRVLEAVTAEQACDVDPKTGKECCTLYKSPDEYRRAKLQASEVLKKLFPSADT